MQRRKIKVAIATLLVAATMQGAATAEESFFSRLNPFRMFKSNRAQVSERSQLPTEQRLEQARTKRRTGGALNASGFDNQMQTMDRSRGSGSGFRGGSRSMGRGRR